MEFANLNTALLAMGNDIVQAAQLELGIRQDRQSRRTEWQKTGSKYQPKRTKTKIRKGKINASGKLRDSLEPKISKAVGGFPTLLIQGEEYGIVINEGREPTRNGGNGQVYRSIKKWTGIKRIMPRQISSDFAAAPFIKNTKANRDAMAFNITRTIHHFGFPATHFMDNAVERIVPKWRDRLAEALAEDLKEIV